MSKILGVENRKNKMEATAAELKKFVGKYIGQLCERHNIDTAAITLKQERIMALAALPEVQEQFCPSAAPGDRGDPIDPPHADPEGSTLSQVITLMARERSDNHKLIIESVATIAERLTSRQENKYIPQKEFNRLTGNDDVILWFATFENLARRHKIERSQMCAALEPFLTDQAQSAYFAIPLHQRDNYDIVKDAIFMRYRLTPSAHRTKFRSENKHSGETFLDYASRLNSYLNHWLSPSEELLENNEALDLLRKIAVGQFISNIHDESLHMKLIEMEDRSIFEIARFADVYFQERRAVRKAEEERNRDADRHLKRTSIGRNVTPGRGAELIGNYNGPGPGTRQPEMGRQNAPGGRYSDACSFCGELGHLRRHCPNL